MNWYKKAQQLEIDESPKGSYLNYGHDVFYGEEYNQENPNYIWAYINGEIVKAAESPTQPGHDTGVFPIYDYTYSGRFDAKQKIITMTIRGDVSRFRRVPKTLSFLLRKSFPEAEKINVY